MTDHPRTQDGRYFVVRGRLWRFSNPELGDDEREKLVRELMAARSTLRHEEGAVRTSVRKIIDGVKRKLGERGAVWWTDGAPDHNRHLLKNTPYADGWTTLNARQPP